MDKLLENLNEPQRQAVTTTEGPLVVIAGAGSGKTRVITCRVAYLIGARRVAPRNILAVTFTNKAAEEMRNRIHRLLGTTERESWIGTFHATCSRLLRREADRLGYTRNFTIYDSSDQLTLVKHCMKKKRLSEKECAPRAVLSHISYAKNDMLSPQAYEGAAVSRFEEQVARIYSMYQDELHRNNAMDFDDLLVNGLSILLDYPECAQKYRSFFRYIMVDEFQDTNRVQYQLVRELSRDHGNLCVVGDDDQSIYSWRGAKIENLFDFEHDFPGAVSIFLEENYRSTQLILDAANMVIENNERRKRKILWTKNKGGDKIVWYPAFNERAEAQYITEQIHGLRGLHTDLANGDFAVFYRTNAQSRVLEDEFRTAGIPYAIIGGMRFYDRMEVKDTLAYLKLIANPSDSVSVRRIINVPPRGIGKATLEKVEEFAAEKGLHVLEAVGRADEINGLRANARKNLLGFYDYISHLIQQKEAFDAGDLVGMVLQTNGYMEMLQKEPTIQAQTRLENLDELVSAAVETGDRLGDFSLDAFLQNVSLQTDIDDWNDKSDVVTLMTLHAAKGLEFQIVFMAGMEEDLFPHANTFGSDRDFEEERRLCYVGITRAKRRLFLTSAYTRMLRGKSTVKPVSRFIDEISAELLESIEPAASFGMGRIHDEYRQEMPDYENRPFEVGDTVEHSTFGKGRVNAVSGNGEKLKVGVRFYRDNKERSLVVKKAGLQKK